MKITIMILAGLLTLTTSCKSFRALSYEDSIKMYEEAVAIQEHLEGLLPQMATQKEALQQLMNRMQIASKPMDMEKFDLWQKSQMELTELEKEINELDPASDSGSIKDFEQQQKKFKDLKARADNLVNRVGEIVS